MIQPMHLRSISKENLEVLKDRLCHAFISGNLGISGRVLELIEFEEIKRWDTNEFSLKVRMKLGNWVSPGNNSFTLNGFNQAVQSETLSPLSLEMTYDDDNTQSHIVHDEHTYTVR